MYEVQRRLGGSGPFTYMGTVGEKRFVDDTLPAGTPSVEYQVTAVRSTRRGWPAHHIVNFGGAARHGLANFRPKMAA
jgi:hypothetical protein